MDETITLFMTTLFLATGGVCLYIYNTSNEHEENETMEENTQEEEELPHLRPKNKTRRNRKSREIER